MTALPDRPLLELGLASDDPWARAVVVSRGFGEATRQQLIDAVSDSEAARLKLTNDLAARRAASATRLLVLLSTDGSPVVRHAAIRALGESGDRAAVDYAWRMAIRDPDPRVSRLADEFRRR